MSSPPSQADRGEQPTIPDPDVDAEMEDIQDASAETSAPRAGPQNEQSSATIEEDFNMQAGTQGTTTGATGLAQQNRKDVTLREFLSKMDDYAPIVRSL